MKTKIISSIQVNIFSALILMYFIYVNVYTNIISDVSLKSFNIIIRAMHYSYKTGACTHFLAIAHTKYTCKFLSLDIKSIAKALQILSSSYGNSAHSEHICSTKRMETDL